MIIHHLKSKLQMQNELELQPMEVQCFFFTFTKFKTFNKRGDSIGSSRFFMRFLNEDFSLRGGQIHGNRKTNIFYHNNIIYHSL